MNLNINMILTRYCASRHFQCQIWILDIIFLLEGLLRPHRVVVQCIDFVAILRHVLLGRLHGDGPRLITPGGGRLDHAVLLPLKLCWIHFSESDHN